MNPAVHFQGLSGGVLLLTLVTLKRHCVCFYVFVQGRQALKDLPTVLTSVCCAPHLRVALLSVELLKDAVVPRFFRGNRAELQMLLSGVLQKT